MDIANKIATEKFATHNAKGDANEPTFDGQKVHMIAEVKEAFDAYVESGLIAGRFDFDEGGMQLPETIMTACAGYFMAANPSSTGLSLFDYGCSKRYSQLCITASERYLYAEDVNRGIYRHHGSDRTTRRLVFSRYSYHCNEARRRKLSAQG